MAQFEITYRKRTIVEGRPGFQWPTITETIKAATRGAAILALYLRGDQILIQPEEVEE